MRQRAHITCNRAAAQGINAPIPGACKRDLTLTGFHFCAMRKNGDGDGAINGTLGYRLLIHFLLPPASPHRLGDGTAT
jgi:hypothetical protein